MAWEYSEDYLIEQTAIDLFFNRLPGILPYPRYQTNDVNLKTSLVYKHLKYKYFAVGVSIYGIY